MGDKKKHGKKDASAGKDKGIPPIKPAHVPAAKSAGDSVVQKDSSGLKALVPSQNDTKVAEDGGKEEFVDCPDEIEASESQHTSEEKDNLKGTKSNEVDSGINVQSLVSEMELLRDKHEKAVAEKEKVSQEYEKERAEITKELDQLCHQLKALNSQQITSGENADGLVNHLQTAEVTKDVKSTSLHEMISECSKLLKNAMDERLETEKKVRDLNAKIVELSESSSKQNEVHIERDRNVEETVNNMLASISMMPSHQEKLLDGSLTEKISKLEKSVTVLVEKYNLFISQSDHLRGCLNEVGSDLNPKDEIGIFVTARDEILELRKREDNLHQNMRNLEDENKKLVEELEKQRSIVEKANAEVEHERSRFANTKEKLSMAVTKGKGLVQQRDSLKQLLAEKMSELEKCSIELQGKSIALEAAEKAKELLAEKEIIIQKCGEILSECVVETEEPTDITDRLRRFARSFSLSKEEAMKLKSEIDKAKEAANDEIAHLTVSLSAEIEEKIYLHAELEELRNKYEAVNNEIDRLKTSLLAESEEKNHLKVELENMREKYEGIVEKEILVSLEKGRIVNMLVQVSGFTNGVDPENSDMTEIIDSCLAKIKENACRSEPSPEILGSFQSLLYIRDQEMSLYKLIVEEDLLERVEARRLSEELETKTREINALKNEKNVMQESVEQLEDRCGLLKEKLSMAVKKGKGLVQDRENLKSSLNEKNTEIDKLKSELEQNLSKMTKLSLDVERIPVLETDLVSAKENSDKLEQFMAESNSMLQRVMEAIEHINTPNDVSFEEAVDKVKWIGGYIRDIETSKMEMEQELKKAKDEASSLKDSLSEAANSRSQLFDEKKDLEVSKTRLEEDLRKEKETIEELYQSTRSLEDSLSLAEDKITRLMNERDVAEENRGLSEDQLKKLKEEFSKLIFKLADAEKTRQSLEDELSRAQKEISLLTEKTSQSLGLDVEMKKIREEADLDASKLADAALKIKLLEDELLKAENKMEEIAQEKKINEEEILGLKSKLADAEKKINEEEIFGFKSKLSGAEKTIISLEDSLAKAQKEISQLAEENSKVQIGTADLDSEMKKTREEADLSARKLADATLKIESLEDELLKAENKMAEIIQEKKINEDEILGLNSKLEYCTEELAATRSRMESRDLELSTQICRLQLLLKDETLSSLLENCLKRKFENLKNVDLLLKEMGDCFLESDPKNSLAMEDDSSISTMLPSTPDLALNTEISIDEVNEVDNETIMLHFENMGEKFRLKGKLLAKKFDTLSTLMDESIAALLRRLHITKDRIASVTKYSKSLEQQMKDMELDKQRHEDTIVSMESEKDNLMSMVDDMQNKVKETQLSYDEALKERDQCKEKISKLETDLQERENLCRGMTIEIDGYKEKVVKMKEREAELSTSLSKAHEPEDSLLSASQVKSILDKINEVEVPDAASAAGDSHDSADVRKLFHVIESFNRFKQNVNALSLENEELQSSIGKQILEIEFLKKQVEHHADDNKKLNSLSLENEELQSTLDKQILEIEFLKKQVEHQTDNNKKDYEKMKKLLELELGLRNIVQKLGGSDLVDNPDVNGSWVGSDYIDGPKEDGPIWILPVLDKLVMATMVESQSLKSKNEELGAKLHGTQKAVDDLSNKVRFLEDSRSAPSEIEQERGTSSVASLSSQPEISEMQDMSKMSNIPLVPSAAHVRTLKKGSSDHLAISIDSESERLINNKESDEDKGHVFKSLNTTGLIPRQGRTAADRVDGIWVTGSRALMKHPRGRLGLIAYWLMLHMWLLASIL